MIWALLPSLSSTGRLGFMAIRERERVPWQQLPLYTVMAAKGALSPG